MFNIAIFALFIAPISKNEDIKIEPFIENLIATLASLFILLIEWVFTDQFLKSVLWLNRRISGTNNVRDMEPYECRKKYIRKVSCLISAGYYAICVSWAAVSIYINEFQFRMSKFILCAVQAVIFLYCLLFLRKLTNEVLKHERNNQVDSEKNNQSKFIDSLMYYNFVSQSSSVLVFGSVFIMHLYVEKNGGEEEASCELNTSLNVLYTVA